MLKYGLVTQSENRLGRILLKKQKEREFKYGILNTTLTYQLPKSNQHELLRNDVCPWGSCYLLKQ